MSALDFPVCNQSRCAILQKHQSAASAYVRISSGSLSGRSGETAHRMYREAEVNPAPKLLSITLSPLCNSPFSIHSERQSGIVADEVLPYLWMLHITRSESSPNRSPTESIIRR